MFRIPVILPKLAEGLIVRFDPLPVTEPMLAPGVLYAVSLASYARGACTRASVRHITD